MYDEWELLKQQPHYRYIQELQELGYNIQLQIPCS